MSAAAPIAGLGGVTTQITTAEEPAAVREGSPKAKEAYETARGFEEVLMSELSQQLVQSSGLEGQGGASEGGEEGGGEEQSSAGGGMLGSLLPQTMTEAVMRSGSLGMANQLMSALDPSAAAPSTTAQSDPSVNSTGGVAA